MNFSEVERRLLADVRRRVRKREISERRLAINTGFSQPHIHNVLKGARQLTSEVADRVMEELGISIEGLLEVSELERALPHRELKDSPFREVPVLKGRVAAGQPFPVEARFAGSRAFTAEFLQRLTRPVLVKVGAGEVAMLPVVQPHDLLLLDQNEEKRRKPLFRSIYALSLKEGGAITHCQMVGRELVMVPENLEQRGFSPWTISLENRNILDLVRGEVVWIGREL